jgi:N-methylhydantoinase B
MHARSRQRQCAEIPSRYSDHLLRPGDVVRLETPGGGGLGNPREREPEHVLNDVRNGYVSVERRASSMA